jgi:hypothetical protein
LASAAGGLVSAVRRGPAAVVTWHGDIKELGRQAGATMPVTSLLLLLVLLLVLRTLLHMIHEDLLIIHEEVYKKDNPTIRSWCCCCCLWVWRY